MIISKYAIKKINAGITYKYIAANAASNDVLPISVLKSIGLNISKAAVIKQAAKISRFFEHEESLNVGSSGG